MANLTKDLQGMSLKQLNGFIRKAEAIERAADKRDAEYRKLIQRQKARRHA